MPKPRRLRDHFDEIAERHAAADAVLDADVADDTSGRRPRSDTDELVHQLDPHDLPDDDIATSADASTAGTILGGISDLTRAGAQLGADVVRAGQDLVSDTADLLHDAATAADRLVARGTNAAEVLATGDNPWASGQSSGGSDDDDDGGDDGEEASGGDDVMSGLGAELGRSSGDDTHLPMIDHVLLAADGHDGSPDLLQDAAADEPQDVDLDDLLDD